MSQPEAMQREQAKSVILVVDDAPAGRETMEALLYSPNYELHFASNGPEALSLAAKKRPDLILLDVMMPGMDGFEVCRRLRLDQDLAEIPVILVTALDDRNSRLQGIDAGADDFITKPFDSAELRARVRTITRLNRYRRLVEERARFEWVVEQAEDGYVLLDGDTIQYANPRASLLLGLDTEPRQPQASFLALAQRQYRCEPEDQWAMWPDLPNTPERQRLYLISVETPVAPAYWIEVTVLSQQVGAHPVRLLRMRNVTAEKTSLRDMWSFHTMVMHKLNTPLHMMLASMELLTLSEPSAMSKEEIVELVEAASNGARRLYAAVTDVLQYASAPSMVARIGERLSVDELQDLASEVAEHLALDSVSIEVEVDPSIQLPIAHRAMESILFELLENAKKFHPTNAPHVCIGVHGVDDDILIVVEDDGIHLSPEQLSRVWLPYYQAERYFTGEVPGMGLGLPIVASIVWESGGHCQIHNRKDEHGVVIELRFPRASEML